MQNELRWLARVFEESLARQFNGSGDGDGIAHLPPPGLPGTGTAYERFVAQHKLNDTERLALILALSPHIAPGFLDDLIQDKLPKAGDFPQIGGSKGKQYRGVIPTGETALFLFGGSGLEKRFRLQQIFGPEHLFTRKRILLLEETPSGEPAMSGRIVLSQEYIDLFTFGKVIRPRFSLTFPAQLIETRLDWDDLVLNPQTLKEVHELEAWVRHGKALLEDWNMGRRLKPGFRALFYGPPGTGKTLTASLLGKYTGKDVYKIDLSMVISKYIGETEKNLANLFAKAENKDWILFFDEADALFGKRTNVKDAHDKYANQEVAYLLQRVEDYNGLVILASNFKSNIDDAFVRRFQAIIHFPMPSAAERLKIWQKAFPEVTRLEEGVSLPAIAQKYELSGANIMNVVQHACLLALEEGTKEITGEMIQKGITKEFAKEGRIG
ncbi:MAG: ATP-binding protein [Phaeodactylibacter sp.]|nr:ATP-binding protein [Phaeodactylibacter sp.]